MPDHAEVKGEMNLMANDTIKITSLRCPNCDQNLEVEDELDTFYCKYCGGKVMLNDETRFQAKMKLKELEKQETIARFELEKERILMEQEKLKMEKDKQVIIRVLIVGFIISILGTLLRSFIFFF